MGNGTSYATIPQGLGEIYIENGSTATILGADESYYGRIDNGDIGIAYDQHAQSHIQLGWVNFTNSFDYRINTTMVRNITITGNIDADNGNYDRYNYFDFRNYTMTVDAFFPASLDDFFLRSSGGSIISPIIWFVFNRWYPDEPVLFTLLHITNCDAGSLVIPTYFFNQTGEYNYPGTVSIGSIVLDIPAMVAFRDNGTINFTTTSGIQANVAGCELEITGDGIDDTVNVTGPVNWYFNTTEWDDWTCVYLNLSNMNNIGDQYFTFAGVNWTGNTQVDNETPVVSWESITAGMILDKTTNSTINVNLTLTDLSYLYEYDYVVGSITTTEDWTDYGELKSYTINNTHDISGQDPGPYTFYLNVSDSHNKPKSPKGMERVKDMVGSIDGDEVGSKKDKKELKDKAGKIVKFKKYSGDPIYQIEWLGVDNNDVTSLIKWTSDLNFKLGHEIKLPVGKSTITARFTGEDIVYLKDSSYYAHLIIDGEYFYDADDWRAVGGVCIVKVVDSGTVDITYMHDDWEAGKKTDPVIDPLSGAVNTLSVTRTIYIGASPSEETVIIGPDWGLLNCSITGIGAYTATICIYDEDNNVLRKRTGILNDGWVRVNWTGIASLTTHRWRASALVNTVNRTSPWFSFVTTSELNVTVVDYWNEPVNGADVRVYAQSGALLYSNTTGVDGTAMGLIITSTDLPIMVVAHRSGNYAQVRLTSVSGNLTIFLYEYVAALEIHFSMVSNYTWEVIPFSGVLDTYLNDVLVTEYQNVIYYPVDYAYFKVYDGFGRVVWSHNYTGLDWSGIPYKVKAYLNYGFIDIIQVGDNGTRGTWIYEWGIRCAQVVGVTYWFTGQRVSIVCWNGTDDYTLIWNETSDVEDGTYEIQDVGVSISSKSPHGNGGMIAQVRTVIKGFGSGGRGGGIINWLAEHIFSTNMWIVIGGVLTFVGAVVLLRRSQRLKEIADDLEWQMRGKKGRKRR